MIFTAYFDEANTHGAAPTIILSALPGHADQWSKFNEGLNDIRTRYHFKTFHAKRFQARKGEFKGWHDAKCWKLLEEMTALTTNTLTERATVHLERGRYLNEYRNQPFPPKMQPDSQFGLCFRMLLLRLLKFMSDQISEAKSFDELPVLHVVVEDGHKNVGAARTIFDEFQRRLIRYGGNVLGGVTIAKKSESPELMAADFVAHTYFLMRKQAFGTEILEGQFNYSDPPHESALASMEFSSQAFSLFKEEYQRDKQQRMEEWRRQKRR